MKICICGGGSLAHVTAAVLSHHQNHSINILTQRPYLWNDKIFVKDIYDKEYIGHINKASSCPKETIIGCDIVLICLPGFLIEETLRRIKPYITDKMYIGSIVSSTGFFFMAHNILDKATPLFGFQRVPYIARVEDYGHRAALLGYKRQLLLATENIEDKSTFKELIEGLFSTPTILLEHFLEASLTNSNPILHTGRLYSLWHNWDGRPYDKVTYFYKEWTTDAAQVIINMDNEFMRLIEALPINNTHITSLLDYYESSDAESLTKKLSTIPAFQSITAPMKWDSTKRGYVPDFNSRYFIEDFPYGLRYIKQLMNEYNIKSPVIDQVYSWGINIITKNNDIN